MNTYKLSLEVDGVRYGVVGTYNPNHIEDGNWGQMHEIMQNTLKKHHGVLIAAELEEK